MKTTHAFLWLTILIFVTFGGILSHGFIGDDHLLFVHNDFYRTPSNMPKLLTRDFITTPETLHHRAAPATPKNVSGCVAYRPVTALSFFADSWLGSGQPFGFHLMTLLLHLGVALAVFSVMKQLSLSASAALTAAAIFAVHPVQAEALNNIGYRSDLLATLFTLLAFRRFVRLRQNPPRRAWSCVRGCGVGGLFFLLALFSKETAVMLPLLLGAYHLLLAPRAAQSDPGEKTRRLCLGSKTMWVGLTILLAGYLFLYFFVFTNATFNLWTAASTSAGASANAPQTATRLLEAVRILSHYLTTIVWPFRITLLPSFYAPSVHPFPTKDAVVVAFTVVAALGVLFLAARQRQGQRDQNTESPRYGLAAFFVCWFFLTYAPASNIFPLPNPMGYRYLYLPMVGWSGLVGLGLAAAVRVLKRKHASRIVTAILPVTLIGALVAVSLAQNIYYENDTTINHTLVRQHPRSAYPYLILGSIYRQAGRSDQAIEAFKKYLAYRPAQTPYDLLPPPHEILTQIGTCHVDDPDQALQYFAQALALKPDDALTHAQLGRALAQKKNYEAALFYTQKSIKLDPDLFIGYFYTIYIFYKMGDMDSAQVMLTRGRARFPGQAWSLAFRN